MPSMGSLAEEGLALMEIRCARCLMPYPEDKMYKEGNEMLCDVCSLFDTVEEAYY